MMAREKLSYLILFCAILAARGSRVRLGQMATSLPLTENGKILAGQFAAA